jgi:hypothetical protein
MTASHPSGWSWMAFLIKRWKMLSNDLKQHFENNKHSGKKYLFDWIIPKVEALEKENEELKIQIQLERLADALIDDIINTPDDEILQEVKEDFGDSNYEADKVRKMIEKIKGEINAGV